MTHYCTMCGQPIPDRQGGICSMCYGDPFHGSDGYYAAAIREQENQELDRQHYEQQLARQEEAPQ